MRSPAAARLESMRSTMKLHSSVLAGLSGFVGVGATVGAVLVVPSLPAVMYRYGGFSNGLVPAIGLGIVGATAYVLVWLQPLFIAIGLAMILLAARSNSEPSGGR
jgi:hypothetical protein